MSESKTTMRVVLWHDAWDLWNAQCLEHDVQTTGDSKEEVMYKLRLAVVAEAEFSVELAGGKPFANIAKAPNLFFDLWEHSSDEFREEIEYEWMCG